MSRRRRVRCWGVGICLLAVLPLAPRAFADGRDAAKAVQGEIVNVDGMRVVRVWGDARERGFAHGYLLAKDIIGLIDGYVGAEKVSGGPRRYEAIARNLDHIMKVPSPYLVEMDGMLAGIQARLNGETTIPRLGRKLMRKDLVVMNCVPDSVGFGCSSFAAWGKCTENGETIAGRNLDWHAIGVLRDSQVVVANIPAKGLKQAAWVSVTWPGLIICMTGMNERGVTVAMHDAYVGTARNAVEMTPRGFALREAVEAARPKHVEADVLGVLKANRVLVGNIVPVSWPWTDGASASCVFEYDGDTRHSKGVTIRHAKPPEEGRGTGCFVVATNHYRDRAEPTACSRFEKLDRRCNLAISKNRPITVDRAWKMLKSVSAKDSAFVTYQSVVFEPNAKRMHVSFSNAKASAPNGKRATLDVAELLMRPEAAMAASQ